MAGIPRNGFVEGLIGELTDVASAKRAARGVLRDRDEDVDDVRGRTTTSGAFFGSDTVVMLSLGGTGLDGFSLILLLMLIGVENPTGMLLCSHTLEAMFACPFYSPWKEVLSKLYDVEKRCDEG
jgi:hypothetical protein